MEERYAAAPGAGEVLDALELWLAYMFRSAEFELPTNLFQVILCGSTLEETLERASSKLGEEISELRSSRGAVIDSISLLR